MVCGVCACFRKIQSLAIGVCVLCYGLRLCFFYIYIYAYFRPIGFESVRRVSIILLLLPTAIFYYSFCRVVAVAASKPWILSNVTFACSQRGRICAVDLCKFYPIKTQHIL